MATQIHKSRSQRARESQVSSINMAVDVRFFDEPVAKTPKNRKQRQITNRERQKLVIKAKRSFLG